jgi:hypothetical protein
VYFPIPDRGPEANIRISFAILFRTLQFVQGPHGIPQWHREQQAPQIY